MVIISIMQIRINAKNFQLTPSLKTYVEQKFGALSRYAKNVTEMHVVLEVSKKHHSGDVHRAEAMIYVPRDLLRAEAMAQDIHAAIDLIVPKLKLQLEKYKSKRSARLIRKAKKIQESVFSLGGILGKKEERAPKYAIVRRKRFTIDKPMTEEEAIEQMNLIGHDFFLFYSADSERWSAVYRRKDGNYGLIEPETIIGK